MGRKLFNLKRTLEDRKLLRREQTTGEKLLWMYLRNRKLNGIKFYRQYGIGPYIADFYSAQLKVVVEVDGPEHHTEVGMRHDKRRDSFLESNGIQVIRFDADVLLQNFEKVYEELKTKLQKIQW